MFRYFYWKTVFFGHVFLSKYLRWIKKTLEIICLFCVYLLICFLLIHCTGFRHLTVVLFALLWVFLLFHRLCSDVLSCVMFYVTELVLFLSLSQRLWWTALLKGSGKGNSIVPERQKVFVQRGKGSSWPQCKPLAFRSTGEPAERDEERTRRLQT